MILVKRIVAVILDFIWLCLICEILYFLFKAFGLKLDETLIVFCAYTIVFLLPIIAFNNTLSERLLNLRLYKTRGIHLKSSLLLKSSIYYFILSNTVGTFFKITESLLNAYTTVHVNRGWDVIFLVVFCSSNVLILVFSKGYFNFLDYLLKISYRRYNKKNHSLSYKIAFLISALYLLLSFFIFKFRLDSYVEVMSKNITHNMLNEYYPSDDLGRYMESPLVASIAKTNNVVSVANPTSIFYNEYLTQKNLICAINEETFNDINRREAFCKKLVIYSRINNIFNGRSPDQTMITLSYQEKKSFFSKYTAIFKYYYEDKAPSVPVYGGINRDDLKAIYDSTQRTYMKDYYIALGKKLKLSVDSLIKYTDSNGRLALPDHLIDTTNYKPNLTISVTPIVPQLNTRLILFKDVEPLEWLELSSPNGNEMRYNLFGYDYDAAEYDFFESKRNYILGQPH